MLDIIFLLISLILRVARTQQACLFGSSFEHRPLLVNINEILPIGSTVIESNFEPENAELSLAFIGRQNLDSLAGQLQNDLFSLSVVKDGRFRIIVSKSLELLPYPSIANEIYVPIKLYCNGLQYPFVTVRIQGTNQFGPQFYGSIPYRISVDESAEIDSTFDTPIVAIDWDPAIQYPVTFAIVTGNEESVFQLEIAETFVYNPQTLPFEFIGHWTTDQFPPVIRIRLKRRLDYDYGTRIYRLNISANDNGHPKLTTFTTLQVNIKDNDDRRPAFTNSEYCAQISADTRVGTVIEFDHEIFAIDGDPGLQTPIVYSLHSLDDGDIHYFRINPETGRIFLIKKLPDNPEPSAFINLIIKATQNDNAEKFVTAMLHLHILYSDKSQPSFSPCIYNTNLLENSPNDTHVVSLEVNDTDSGDNGRFSYYLLNDNDSKPFQIDANSGLITVAKSELLDREKQSIFNLRAELQSYPNENQDTVLKSDAGCSTASITIHLLDDNDNAPMFEMDIYRFSIRDSTEKGAIIGFVNVNDADKGQNGVVIYGNIEQDEIFDGFRFGATVHENGSLAIKLIDKKINGRIPYPPVYRLRLLATDGGRVPKFTRLPIEITIELTNIYDLEIPADLSNRTHLLPDLNEGVAIASVIMKGNPNPILSPRFEQSLYVMDLAENSSPTKIGKITAMLNDDDDRVSYSMVGDDLLFSIDETDGTVKGLVKFDYEDGRDYTIEVEISILDSPLHFPSQLFRLIMDENSPIGYRLNQSFSVFGAHRYPHVRYDIFPDHPFSIDENSATITVIGPVNLEKMPKESRGVYELTIYAKSGLETASTILQIKVNDVNEFSPEFDRKVQVLSVKENVRPGDMIVQLNAYDGDFSQGTELTYQIREGPAKDYLQVTGTGLVLKSTSPMFDREISDEMFVIIEAIDKDGKTAEILLELHISDINDNAPIFINQPYLWNVTEGLSGIGQTFRIRTTDADIEVNAEITFKILQGNEHGLLSIENISSNEAELSVIASLDREWEDTLNILVEAMDGGKQSLFSMATIRIILIDANDNAPKFEKANYRKKVPADFPIGFTIFQLRADDPDSSSVISYRIVDEENDIFSIDSDQGSFYLLRSPPAKNRTYSLTIQANDTVFTDYANVSIDIYNANENIQQNRAPEFLRKQYHFRIVEGESNIAAGKVEALDSDSDQSLEMWIEPEDYRHFFNIDNEIVATDRDGVGNSNSANLTVFVSPATITSITISSAAPENCQPYFSSPSETLVLFETLLLNLPLLSIPIKCSCSSFSKCLPIEFEILPDPGAEYFVVSLDGMLILTKKLDVDLMKTDDLLNENSSFSIRIQAALVNGNKAQLLLTITVLKSNALEPRNGLRFSNLSYHFSVFEEMPISTFVGLIKAEISDKLFSNQPITYTLIDSEHFRMNDSEPGRLETKTILDGDRGNVREFKLIISADSGSLHATALTTIEIVDINDNKPKFSSDIYSSIMPEGSYGNGAIVPLKPGQLKAFDTDQDKNARITYAIVENEFNRHPFYVKNETGELVMFGTVDREITPFYNFTIMAFDNGIPPLNHSTVVNVTILDVNDNYPEFISTAPKVVALSTDFQPGREIAIFEAEDRDGEQFGQISYSLHGNDSRFFAIDVRDGILTIIRPISAENQLFVTIVASDFGRPPLRRSHTLRIEIFEPNQYYPEFKKTLYTASICDNANLGDFIIQLVAGVGNFEYRLNDDYSNLFEIDNESAIITLGRFPDDQELNRYFILNVTATNVAINQIAWTTVNILLESEVTSIPDSECSFSRKQYDAEIYENEQSKKMLIDLNATCNNALFSIEQRTDEFEIDKNTGKLFAIHPLDREKRSLYFIVINVANKERSRTERHANPLIEKEKSRLKSSQTLVLINIRDKNDNHPAFINLNSPNEKEYIFTFDWQDHIDKVIGKVQANDLDEKSSLKYSILKQNTDDGAKFSISSKEGNIFAAINLMDSKEAVFKFTARISDGELTNEAPVTFYKLAPNLNLIVIEARKSPNKIIDWTIERKISNLINYDTKVLFKQVFVHPNRDVDPKRTQLYIYALDLKTGVPLESRILKKLLDGIFPQLQILPELQANSITLASLGLIEGFSHAEMILLVICILIILTVFLAICLMYINWDRKNRKQIQSEYMMNSHSSGPRPYNVEVLDRKTAQKTLISPSRPDLQSLSVVASMDKLMAAPYTDAPENNRISSNPYHSPMSPKITKDAEIFPFN